MTAWIEILIGFITVLITNGAFFYTINRKIRKTELKDKEIEVIKKQDDEWQELYEEEKAKRIRLEEEKERYIKSHEELVTDRGKLELQNLQLSWYRCTVNNCPNRRPPHVFDHDGNELESCS